jgi:glutathione S-transferase
MEARLYVIPGSHPSMAARLMLEAKGIRYKRTDLMPVVSKGVLRGLGFPRNTVPAIKIDGRKVQGTGEIARELDRLRSEPALIPADPEKREAVEEAERFGDQELQPSVRAILWWALRKDKAPLRSYSEGAKLGIPIGLALKTAAPIVAASAHFNEATDENVRSSLAAMPAMLQRIDDWIAVGTIGGEQPNIADFQIAPSLRLAMTLDDLRPSIEGRPAGELAKRVVPNYPGKTPPILPPAWLQPLRSETAAA